MHSALLLRPRFVARPSLGAAATLLAALSLGAHAGQAHVHGAATLDVAIEGERLALEFATPLDNLVGFERAPRTDQEKVLVRQIMERLSKPEELFVPSPGARCTRTAAHVDAPVLDAPYKAPKGEHAALTAKIEFRCEQSSSLRNLRVTAFDAFPRLKRIDVQVASGNKQRAATLTSSNRTIFW